MSDATSRTYLIVGGHGYIGRCLAARLLADEPAARVVVTDRERAAAAAGLGAEFVAWDVRQPAPEALRALRPDWIFNFAAVHREPGHAFEEYFDTNLPGARHVVALAEATGCRNVFFTSSIAVYGPTRGATREDSPKYPSTGYGISKYLAEQLHQTWQAAGPERRLVMVRPGVIYGPHEQGNIRRMVHAIRKGIFVLPGDPGIRKSYGYIEGLLDSIRFTRERVGTAGHPGPVLIYNYVESPTEPLGELARLIAKELGRSPRVLRVPLFPIVAVAHVVQALTGGRSPIHPARVRKVATPTEIVPDTLLKLGFPFRYTFADSLKDWRAKEAELWR
ncbi:NAD-dependent epimerase/dehydratase family protein [Nibricoccus sp. IMCC34717]|uniref:NAD-dependent epimerase/dehydratase family protein n=1 Tax=Nibricoccus sp. IMCC34717 TaxID=3034021 RepID=UPI00384C9C57